MSERGYRGLLEPDTEGYAVLADEKTGTSEGGRQLDERIVIDSTVAWRWAA